MKPEIQFYGEDKLQWAFNADSCYFGVPSGGYIHQEKVDPFPAYAHNIDLVEQQAKYLSALFPIDFPITICVLSRESLGRTNGMTMVSSDYSKEKDENGKYPNQATIILCGKRIPIHPAMTRYLVSHEYGHVAKDYVHLKMSNEYPGDKFLGMYRTLRDEMPSDPISYGGGWHRSIKEVFANDFRILVAHSEIEFWPHEGISRPEQSPRVILFWEQTCKNDTK